MISEYTTFIFVPYGSRLYGTSTPESDYDNKVVYLPPIGTLLLNKKLKIYKTRVDAAGEDVPDNVSMPDGGIETEYIPLHQFVWDFVAGQTYALEIAHAYLSFEQPNESETYQFVDELVQQFTNSNVYSMVSFAAKQTLDYVKRGDRLNDARRILKAIDDVQAIDHGKKFRLDSKFGDDQLLDLLAMKAGLQTSTSENNGRVIRTLELNGRSYLETTTLDHIRTLVMKLVQSYGDRSTAAAETDVDYKSLSHAVRVYLQAIELLDTGHITFPRPDAEFLLRIKQGKENPDSVKAILSNLDETVKAKVETSKLQARTPALEQAAAAWLLEKLYSIYSLELS